ncbi:unnamed protein product [Rhodiola kirilowii]
MSDIKSLDLLEEIQTLVCDRLQVVSYKWLSRNYLLSSSVAKRLLQEYVDKYGQGFKVVYALSGWLKSDPPTYRILLASGINLEESKQEFEGNCSIQVYSVQASLPKDPATLWNTEFVQSEELYKQPVTVINCLRDNRFGGISNSSIKRSADGISVSISSSQSKGASSPGVLNSNIIPKTITSFSEQSKVPQPRVEGSVQPAKLVAKAKSTTKSAGAHECPSDNERLPPSASNKKKGQSDIVNTGKGESLASMWDRAPKKTNPTSPSEDTTSSIPPSDDQTKANKGAQYGGSDDEGEHVNVKRSSQKPRSHKRRVVLDSDDEDENEDAVNLSSPDVPKEKSCSDRKQSNRTSLVKEQKIHDENKECRPVLQKEKETKNVASEGKNVAKASLTEMKNNVPENIVKRKVNQTNPAPAPASPKRKKVLKTHIDERGREVTEVVWEGEDEKKKSDETSTDKRTDGSTDLNIVNRPIGQNKKSPAVGSTAPTNPSGKAGNKKTGKSKDPKQGNLMSFFKRV